MIWQEDEEETGTRVEDDEVVDLLFNIRCQSIPIDHGEALKKEISALLKWLDKEDRAAIHQIHVAESAHGWQRPDKENGLLLPSRRTKLVLRMPRYRIDDCYSLVDRKIDIEGHVLEIGNFKTRALSRLTTLFSRYIETQANESEEAFIQRVLEWFNRENIGVKKMMCGLQVEHRVGDCSIVTRKLMLSGLTVNDSIRLQYQGMGEHMLMGIGIFLPHKGIDAVKPA